MPFLSLPLQDANVPGERFEGHIHLIHFQLADSFSSDPRQDGCLLQVWKSSNSEAKNIKNMFTRCLWTGSFTLHKGYLTNQQGYVPPSPPKTAEWSSLTQHSSVPTLTPGLPSNHALFHSSILTPKSIYKDLLYHKVISITSEDSRHMAWLSA